MTAPDGVHPELAEADKIADPVARTLAYAHIAKKATADTEATLESVLARNEAAARRPRTLLARVRHKVRQWDKPA